MPSNTERLISFVKRELKFVPAASCFTLVGLIEGDLLKLGKFRVKDGRPEEETVNEIVTDVEAAARSCAESMNLLAKFRFSSFVRVKPLIEGGKWTLKRQADMVFVVPGKLRAVGTEEGNHLEHEPPTATGFQGQLMRHLEAKERTMMTLMGDVLNFTQRENQRLSAQVETYHKKEAEVRAEREVLLSNAHEREIEKQKLDADQARKNMLLAALMKETLPLLMAHLPDVFEKLMGKKPELGAQTDDKFSKIRVLFEGIDEKSKNEAMRIIMESNPATATEIASLLF